jgi:hypothetical protein
MMITLCFQEKLTYCFEVQYRHADLRLLWLFDDRKALFGKNIPSGTFTTRVISGGKSEPQPKFG